MLIEKPLFPTLFYEIDIDSNLALKVLNEIKDKQNQINTVSEATQIHPVSDYSTDFLNTIPIETFDNEVIPYLQHEWAQLNTRMENIYSWVSCYTGPHGCHPMHNHQDGYRNNLAYSAILYLTSVGSTDFFTVAPSAHNYIYAHESRIGNVIFFPSIIPHQYRTESYDGNNRYTLPFNCELVPCGG